MSDGLDTVRVRKLDCRYLVPHVEPDRAAVRARLDRTATSSLAVALGGQLEPLLAPLGDGIWLIRRLELDLDLDTSASPAAIARRWAAAIARSLVRALGERDGVVHFRDEAAHLAHYLEHRLTGEGGSGRWYHAAFAGYDAMPVGMAARAVAVDTPETALAAFAAMSSSVRQGLVEVMSEADAELAGRALSVSIQRARLGSFEAHASSALANAARRFAGAAPRRTALAVVLDSSASGKPVSWQDAFAAAQLMASIRQADPAERSRLVAAIETGAGAGQLLVRLAPTARVALAACDAEVRAEIAAAALRVVASTAPAEPGSSSSPRHTRFGGLAMLIPFVAELDELAPAIRLVVVAKVAGGERAAFVFGDPVCRDLLGVGPHVSLQDVATASMPPAAAVDLEAADAAWLSIPELAQIDAARDHALSTLSRQVLGRFAARLPGFSASTARHLYANFLSTGATVVDDETETLVIVERPPIHVILTMTTLARTRFTPPWRERPIRITEAPR